MRRIALLLLLVNLASVSVSAPALAQAAPAPAPESTAPPVQDAAAPAPEGAPAPAATPPPAPTPPPAAAPAPALPPSQFPPPPPGYVYAPAPYYPAAPPPSSPELEQINTRLRELERARGQYSIGGPIAMMATGYGTALVFGLVSLAAYATAESIEDGHSWDDEDWDDNDWNDDGVVDGRDERDARSAARATVGIAAAGLALGLGGTLFLAKRLAKRGEYAPEIRDLRERRQQLMYGLRYGANLAPGQMQLSISGRF